MYTLDHIQARKGQLASDSHGEAVYEKITETVKQGNGRGRWFWELLQNSMDAVDDDKRVTVELMVREDKLVFRHDGNPFNMDEILKLIIQGTTKKSATDKRGRFGTGFISTYLLSRQVQIEGLLDDGSKFSFLLDREARSVEEFIEKQEACILRFYASQEPANGVVWTSFTYFPDEDKGKPNVKMGMDMVDEFLPYVLAFNKKFEQITVDDNGNVRVYKLGGEDVEGSIRNRVVTVSGGDQYGIVRWVEGEKWQAAYKLMFVDGRWVFAGTGTDFPNLFLSFPLIGTEVLGLPVVIHSEEFDVKAERNGVYLGKTNDANIVQNKAIITGAVDAIGEIVKWAVKHSVGRIYNAMTFRPGGGIIEWLDKDWLREVKVKALGELIKTPAVYPCLEGAEPIAVADAFIPFNDSVDLRIKIFELGVRLFASKLAWEREPWWLFCQMYKEVMNVGNELPPFYFTLAALCSGVQGVGSWDGLNKELDFGGYTKDWLKGLYEVIVGAAEKGLFATYAIIPTYLNGGLFRRWTTAMRFDAVDDGPLLDIAFVTDQGLPEKLVPHPIELPDGLCESLTRDALLDQMQTYFTKSKPAEYFEDRRRKANAELLRWLVEAGDKDRIRMFPVVCRGRDKEKDPEQMYMCTLGGMEKSKMLMAPVALWRDKFPVYAEILREKNALDKEYFAVLEGMGLAYLADMGLIHLCPLIRLKDSPTQQILDRLVADRDQLSLLSGPDGMVVREDVEFTDFAYLGSSDEQLLSSTSFANSARILTFVLKEAVETDMAFEETYPVIGVGNAPVTLRRAQWVGRLRNNAWVSVKREGGTGGVAGEQPSAQNLAGLIKVRPELKTLVQSEKARKLLSMWGVSVSDLLRNLLSDEFVRAAWDRAFIDMLSSSLDPEEASAIAKDDKFRDEYRKRRERARKIKENQDLGAKMERAFKKLFLRPEYAHLQVKRKPWGSDFEMEFDLVNEVTGQEELLEIGPWLLELKATGRDYAGMTPLQGETAVTNKDHYALVVLPLNGEEITEDSILQRARFVVRIGHVLEGKYKEVTQMREQQALVASSTDELEVSLEGEQLRYNIRQKVWQEEGVSLEGFLQEVVARASSSQATA